MFAARANQENTIHHPQTTKSLAPKTPSGKTPFHPGGGKNNENVLPLPGKTGGKPDRNAFLTPANPRTRAPLGNKTTNAKALQPTTIIKPAPPSSTEEGGNNATKSRRPKIKVHASTTVPTAAEEDPLEREIEYMPPREIPMIDHSLDEEIFPRGRDLSCLQGKNLTRGWYGEYAQQVEKDDEGEMSDFGEKLKELERRRKKSQAETANVGSVRAKNAVGALSKKETSVPAARKPFSAAAAGRMPTTTGKPSAIRPGGVSAPGNQRFTAAKVASNSTIGYSKGRVVSRPKLGAVHMKPVVEEKKTTLEDLLTGFGDLGIDDAEADAVGLGGYAGEIVGEEEDGDVFQLEALGENV